MDEVPRSEAIHHGFLFRKGSLWVESMAEPSQMITDRKTRSSVSFKRQNAALLNDFTETFLIQLSVVWQVEPTDVVVFSP